MNYFKRSEVKKIIIIACSAFFLVALAISNKDLLREELGGMITGQSTEMRLYDGQSAYDVALFVAQKWRSDAVLSSISSGAEGEEGDYWKLIFISVSNPGARYVMKIRDNKIISASEAAY